MQPPYESAAAAQNRLTQWVNRAVGSGRSGKGTGGREARSARSLKQLAKWRRPPSAAERSCEFDYDYYVAIGARQRPFRRVNSQWGVFR